MRGGGMARRLLAGWPRGGGGGMGLQRRAYRASVDSYTQMVKNAGGKEREAFWRTQSKGLDWVQAPQEGLDASRGPMPRWFSDGVLNVCYNAVDRWVERGSGDRIAVQYDSPAAGCAESITFRDLQDRVARFSGALADSGIGKGDRVVIYMPMIPEAVVAMLACARLGAVHSVVFGGFASKELAARIDDAKPKAVISATCGIEPSRIVPYEPLLEGAVDIARHKPELVVVKHRREVIDEANRPPKDGYVEWDTFLAGAAPHDCVPVQSTDPLYLIYTSGTTAQPKGVLRDSGGYATAMRWSMEHYMGLAEGECYWAASDIGWTVGHSYVVYGPLLHGCTTVMFEGKPILPDGGVFWRVASEHKVNALFMAPTAARAIRKVDPDLALAKQYDLEALRTVFLAGERADPDTVDFFARELGKPIVDNYWQTELGWPALGMQFDNVGARPGSAGLPVPGYDMHVLCESTQQELGPGELGEVCIKLPLPPGGLLTLFNAEERCKEVYFSKHPGYYTTGDTGFRDELGYFHVMARTDDVINCAGHRLSSGGMEEALIGHPDVVECAVIAAAHPEKHQVPLGLVVLRNDAAGREAEVERELVQKVREDIGPVAFFKTAIVVPALPKTRSGKILRNIMSKMADGLPFAVPGTIEDPAVVQAVQSCIEERWMRQQGDGP